MKLLWFDLRRIMQICQHSPVQALIVGLGNPGAEYDFTRHNAGKLAVQQFAKGRSVRWRSVRLGRLGYLSLGSARIVLFFPSTYMNDSGRAVKWALRETRVKLEQLIVVHDDMDLPLGRLRVSFGSRSAGHRGVQSIIEAFGSREFARLRLGIGRPGSEENAVDYVLGRFTQSEAQALERVMELVSEALECIVLQGIEAALARYK